MDFFVKLFRADFMPHGHCFFWRPDILWLTIVSDSLIFLSYMAIPVVLIDFVRKRKDLAFNWIFYMFAAFIVFCGLTHAVSILTLWIPVYRAEGLLKLVTGLVSVSTAIMLAKLSPSLLRYPSPQDLGEANARLSVLNEELESRVTQRTAELAEARDAALEANRSKSLFLAMMSHEIRTPLNGIIGTISLLGDTNPTPAQTELVEIVRLSGDALLTVINDILDFSKIEAGKLAMESLHFSLRKTLEQAVGLVTPEARKKGLELRFRYDTQIPALLMGDHGRVRQVLLNLLSNAVKFTKAGHVSCEVSLVSTDAGKVQVRCDVVDTGIGISAAAQKRLFQAFTQADSSTSRHYGGTGLGLTICSRLVDMMDGSIHVESQEGHGSRFWFDICLLIGPVDGTTAEGTVNLRGKRILIVDDKPINRTILRRQLELEECECFEAADGVQALQILFDNRRSAAPIEAGIIDAEMPLMDGYLLVRSIRSHMELHRLPLVMVSSSGLSRFEEYETDAVDAILTKPISDGVLSRALSQAFARLDGEEQAIAVPSVPTAQAGLMQVLVAEDNGVNQVVMKRLLERLGCVVTLVGSGEAAVKAVKEGCYSLVLMDCHMPIMDGYDAARTIREWEAANRRAATPIVAVTADASAKNRQECLATGMDSYITKPVTAQTISETVSKWAVARGLEQER